MNAAQNREVVSGWPWGGLGLHVPSNGTKVLSGDGEVGYRGQNGLKHQKNVWLKVARVAKMNCIPIRKCDERVLIRNK